MASGTRSGKQPASVAPDEDTVASPSQQLASQQLAIRAFTPEQDAALDQRFNDINSSAVANTNSINQLRAEFAQTNTVLTELMEQMRLMNERLDRQQQTSSSPIIPSIETSPPAQSAAPAAPAAPPLPPNPLQMTSPHQVLKTQVLKPKDVGLFNPDVADEHGLGPVATISSDTVYRDIYTWVERLKDLVHVHDPDDVKQVIQPCLRGSAATWWIAELTDEDRRKLRAADLQRWYSLLIKRFKIQTSVAISRITSSSYSPQDLTRGSPRIWIHQMLHYAKAAEMDSTFNQLILIWNRFDANLRKDIPMPKPTTRLVDFLEQIDAMYPTWVDIKKQGSYGGSRHFQPQGLQPHGFQPQGPYQDRRRDPPQDPQRNQSQNPGQSQAGPPNRNVQFERRPRIWRGKEHSKDGYSYMVDICDDGTPRWVDEDPEDPDNDNGHAEYG